MNSGIVTSFIIAAILLIGIAAMNINIAKSGGELTLRQITQQNVTATAGLITHDIPKIGYKKKGNISDADAIKKADSDKLAFYSDIDLDGTTEAVVWVYTSAEVTDGSNPDDFVLKRTAEDSTGIISGVIDNLLGGGSTSNTTEITFGVTDFNFIYYDKNRDPIPAPVSNPADIKQIKVKFTIESKEKYKNSGKYTQSVWVKTFTPKNID